MMVERKCYWGIPYCTLGVLAGILVGLVEFVDSRWLGFRVYYKGEPSIWTPLLWHMATWAGIFYLLARLLEQRQVAQDAAAIIADQYDKLVASQKQLMRSAKLAALGELSASMAHEIRNPLGIIRS